MQNKFECARRCSLNNDCQMISFKSNQCKLFKQVKYSLSTNATVTEAFLYEKFNPDYSSINSYLTNYWPFNNDLKDIVGGADITVGYMNSYAIDRLNKANSALYINYGYVKPPSGVYFNGDFTICFWIKLLVNVHTSMVNFGTNMNDDVYFGTVTTYIMNYYISNSGLAMPNTFSTANSVKLNVWQHYTVTLTGSISRIYINGILNIQSTAKSPRPINRYSNWIGSNNWNEGYHRFYMDDLKIFNRSLTQTEILKMINSYY